MRSLLLMLTSNTGRFSGALGNMVSLLEATIGSYLDTRLFVPCRIFERTFAHTAHM